MPKHPIKTLALMLLASYVSGWILSRACDALGLDPWASLGVLLPCNTLASWLVLRHLRGD